jgi:hypothetical protein
MLMNTFRVSSLAFSFLAASAGLLVGLALHFLAVYLRDYGPEGAGFSLRGNGALIVLPVAVALLLAGALVCAQRRAWLGMVLLPVAMFLGMFVIAGSF